MISAVAEMYEIHPQTLRLYTEEDLQRLEFILNLARDLGVNIAGIAIIIQMRERMEEMNRNMQEFVRFVQSEVAFRASHAHADPSQGAIIPIRRAPVPVSGKNKRKS